MYVGLFDIVLQLLDLKKKKKPLFSFYFSLGNFFWPVFKFVISFLAYVSSAVEPVLKTFFISVTVAFFFFLIASSHI